MAPVLVIFDDTILALRCREGAIHPISLNFRRGWRADHHRLGTRCLLCADSGRSRRRDRTAGVDP